MSDNKALTHQDTGNRAIVIATTVGVVILVIMLVWLRDYFFLVRNDVVQDQVLAVSSSKLADLHAREAELLYSYGWVDQEKGIVRIPIERAMELTVQEARGQAGP